MAKSKLVLLLGTLLTTIVVGCGGFTYTTVGGSVTGLNPDDVSNPLVLRTDQNYIASLYVDGAYSFNAASNGDYTISILTQPNRTQCAFVNAASATGHMSGDAPVNNINVKCEKNVQVQGTIENSTGLTMQLKLRDTTTNTDIAYQTIPTSTIQAPDSVAVTLDKWVINGHGYEVSVSKNPGSFVCSVDSNGTRTANNTDVTPVKFKVICAKGVTLGGTVSGLGAGKALSLSNGADTTVSAIIANGPFTFKKNLSNGEAYHVLVATQPVGQTCNISTPDGTADISNTAPTSAIAVTCVDNVN